MRTTSHCLAVLSLVAMGAACGGSNSATHDGGSDAPPLGSGGQTTTGGASGSATGGKGGSGGSSGSGGAGGRATGGGSGSGSASGGATGSGGTAGSDGGPASGGVSGSGGRATGGTTASGGSGGGGTGGATGLDGGRLDASLDQVSADMRSDVGRDLGLDTALDGDAADSPVDLPLGSDAPADNATGMTLESCFLGLPAQLGSQMIATKSTADGRVRMRIALDTEDRMGTSGTYGWGLIRLAVEVDGVVTCMTDRPTLRYTGSHHNCSDTATAKSGTTTYTIAAPDRPTATLTIDSNGTPSGPYTLTDTTCTMSMSPGVPVTCRSGAPC